jgi:putative transposase
MLAIEDLAVKNMVGNRRLARAIADCGWGTFRAMLAYKAERAGRTLVVLDRWYPSSKTCSGCGHLLSTLSLGTRSWVCPSCGARHDRDLNAAKNILAAGRAVAACGADISHAGSPRVRSAVKQEPQRVTAGIPGPPRRGVVNRSG